MRRLPLRTLQARIKLKLPLTKIHAIRFPTAYHFTFHLREKNNFNFYIRIPGWCKDAHVLINGAELNKQLSPGTYLQLHQEYKEGDKVTVILPSPFKLTPGSENGISIERGPLLYSLKINENWKVDTQDVRVDTGFSCL